MRYHRPIWATPAKVKEVIPMTQKELASALGVSVSYLNTVLNGRNPMTTSLAIDLAAYFNTDVGIWLKADSEYRNAYFYAIKHKPKKNPGFDNINRQKLVDSLEDVKELDNQYAT